MLNITQIEIGLTVWTSPPDEPALTKQAMLWFLNFRYFSDFIGVIEYYFSNFPKTGYYFSFLLIVTNMKLKK